jgi:VanZ family protein
VSGPGRSRARLLALWIPSLAWMAVIFRVSAIPGSRLPGGYSTLGHFVSYAILGGLLVLPLRPSRSTAAAVAVAVIVASLYGITDEFHQAFVPLRTPDVVDWGVDTLGAFAGALAATCLAYAWQRWTRRLVERA